MSGFLKEEEIKSEKEWEEEWQGMPEFIQNKYIPYKEIVIRFESEEAVQKFARIMRQNILESTKWLWYPKIDVKNPDKKHGLFTHTKKYVDES